MARAKESEGSIIKMQANVRGFLLRKDKKNIQKDVEAKSQFSNRSKKKFMGAGNQF